jgi:hypothetical protein
MRSDAMTTGFRKIRGLFALGTLVGSLFLAAPPAAMANETDSITLTAGIVKAIDHASGVVLLDSGRRLRVRVVIVNDQIADVSTVRLDDTIFVSGIEIDPASAAVRTGR